MPGPADSAALYARASSALAAGREDEAAVLLQALLSRDPGHADGWNLAGILRQRARDPRGAIGFFRQSLAAGGGAGVWVNLGFAHQKLGEAAPAIAAFSEALRRDPSLAIAWQKLAGLKEAQGDTRAALAAYRRAVQCDPRDLKSLGDGLYLRRHLADWAEDTVLSPARLLQGFAAAARSDFSPGLLLSLPEADPAAQLAAARLFARTQWAGFLAEPPLAPAARRREGPLRIGYLSADFCNHAVSFLVTDVLAAHDRDAVRVSAYAYRTPAGPDPWREAVRRAVDDFVDIEALDDRAAARRIADDGIDVLVDLTGYTGSGRLGINALRPAPVIVQWIGYIGTLGEPRLADYVIGDPVATPPEVEPFFSEAIARLPGGFQPNGERFALPPAPSRAGAGLPAEGVVFCSFNQSYKFNPPVWDDWCAILRGVPGSVLWLAPPKSPLARENLRAEATRRGVDGARIVFGEHLPRTPHLARLALADLALDTYPYNSGTTASDALRVGVPVLSFPGRTFVGRMATSLLHAAGLPECVAADRGALVAMAIRLGKDGREREALRAKLASSEGLARLFDPRRFAGELERLYAAMHAQALAGRRESFSLAAAPRDA